MPTVFYSWQDDRLKKHNRFLIRDALEQAIKNLGETLSLEQTLELDHDTKGLPGTPDIPNAILEKIQAASAFVADVTFIAETETGKHSCNPNVLLEYGYAMDALGFGRILGVINEAYGSAKKLPFNLSHRRHPVRYTLEEDATSAERKSQLGELARNLEAALADILVVEIHPPEPEAFSPRAPVHEKSSFLADGEKLVGARMDAFRDLGDIRWLNGPQVFLRLIPVLPPSRAWEPLELEELFGRGGIGLGPLAGPSNYWHGRNKYGAVTFGAMQQSEPQYTDSFSQAFRTGEIWGVDRGLLRESDEKTGVPYIHGAALVRELRAALLEYCRFADKLLDLK